MSAAAVQPAEGRDGDRRALILAAAERAFLKDGFHAASMQTVAAEAGMSPGNLYRYFRSKEDIIAGIAERDRGIAPALRHDLGTERDFLHAAFDQMVLRQLGQSVKEVALADGCELLRGFGAVAFRDAGDDVFLGTEVSIEAARAHSGLGADLMHRGLVEP